jgi:predicted ATPase
MYELAGQGCQLVIATHSPILLSFPEARIYELSGDGSATVAYDESELVQLYRSFLAAPERYLRRLVEPEKILCELRGLVTSGYGWPWTRW